MPQKSELKVREFEVYNAYYCAVCHSIRDRYGQIPRLLLTYDSVFLAMILSSSDEKKDEISQFRCMTHFSRERNITKATLEIDYAADMMILLGYYNLRDDFEDERSIIGLAGSTYLKRAYKKISKKYPEKSEAVGKYLKKLTEIEKRGSRIFDEAAEPFSLLMEEIFDYRIPGDGSNNHGDDGNQKSMDETIDAYKAIGFHLGKWIYLIDAFDDLEKDIKKKNYNPVIRQFDFGEGDYEGETLEDFKTRTNERIRLNLTLYLANIGEQVEQLTLKKNKEIIENIIFLGLMRKTDEILTGDKEKSMKVEENTE